MGLENSAKNTIYRVCWQRNVDDVNDDDACVEKAFETCKLTACFGNEPEFLLYLYNTV